MAHLPQTVSRGILSLTSLFLLWFIALPAHAAEHLKFDQSTYKSSELLIKSYLRDVLKQNRADYTLAGADLNLDSQDEFILKPLNCEKSCRYLIMAESGRKIIELGTIEARRLALGDNYNHGIRNILAFNSETNDYEYERYIWDPQLSRYILSE